MSEGDPSSRQRREKYLWALINEVCVDCGAQLRFFIKKDPSAIILWYEDQMCPKCRAKYESEPEL